MCYLFSHRTLSLSLVVTSALACTEPTFDCPKETFPLSECPTGPSDCRGFFNSIFSATETLDGSCGELPSIHFDSDFLTSGGPTPQDLGLVITTPGGGKSLEEDYGVLQVNQTSSHVLLFDTSAVNSSDVVLLFQFSRRNGNSERIPHREVRGTQPLYTTEAGHYKVRVFLGITSPIGECEVHVFESYTYDVLILDMARVGSFDACNVCDGLFTWGPSRTTFTWLRTWEDACQDWHRAGMEGRLSPSRCVNFEGEDSRCKCYSAEPVIDQPKEDAVPIDGSGSSFASGALSPVSSASSIVTGIVILCAVLTA